MTVVVAGSVEPEHPTSTTTSAAIHRYTSPPPRRVSFSILQETESLGHGVLTLGRTCGTRMSNRSMAYNLRSRAGSCRMASRIRWLRYRTPSDLMVCGSAKLSLEYGPILLGIRCWGLSETTSELGK